MATSAAVPPGPPAQPKPYPEEADGKIRKIAELFDRGDILQLLEDVRNNLLGNAVQVQNLAMEFAKNHTLADAGDNIDEAVQSVSGTWSGRAADQFATYASRVGKALEGQQNVVAGMSGVLTDIAGCVIETYSKAIEFIGACAVELGKLGYKTIIAAVTSVIPIADIFTSKDLIDAVVDAFATLVESIVGLFAQARDTLGGFKQKAIALVQGNTDFPDIPELPGSSGIDDEKQWRVEPSAAPA
ncbi:WXG100 family type VII secretion target [Amycolatopsis carbonis]|uniref:WXG100 family type VII secretion target n=1 Tax=Amycolatopsis carbonis TaxID=715471 RepID=A0A9Y2MVQ0_9PSEU|nr:WXG100 family type VII secretion target [Amycolatopsis sp. 2-15]WIX76962.1 WXG100 family type VII secretion target [Amycolatopsis sp. 2-15]